MSSELRQCDALKIRDRYDVGTYSVTDAVFDDLQTDGGNLLLSEACDMPMFESTHFYDTDIHESHTLLLEAITTTRARISQTMRAFIRALNASLQGTDITAGVTDGSDVDGDSKVLGGAEIGKARKSAGLAVLPARIPLSDGQSVTIVFHSPSGDVGKITAQDTLVAFRFYLNKRDVTHVVAPMSGRDLSLKQTTQVLANLIERNSPKFQRSRDKNAKLLAEIEEQDVITTGLEEESQRLVIESESLLAAGQGLDSEYDKYRELADNQAQINAGLMSEISKLEKRGADTAQLPAITDKTRQIKENLSSFGTHTLSDGSVIQFKDSKVTITTPENTTYTMESESMQGGTMSLTAMKLLKLYRDGKAAPYIVEVTPEPDPVPEPDPIPDPEPTPDPEPDPTPDIQPSLDAIHRAENADESLSIQNIKQLVKDLRGAYAGLAEAGVLEEYEGRLNEAADHLGDLLNKIATVKKE